MRRVAPVALLALLLAGCASEYEREGFERVASLAAPALGATPQRIRSDEEARAARAASAALLARPLSADDAVQLALLNNRGLQASYAELGIAAADLALAGRLPNPGFSYARLERGGELEIERAFSLPLLKLLVLPFAQPIEARLFERAQLRAASEVLGSAAQVRRAYFDAVAAAQTLAFVEQAKEAAEARAELGRRLYEVGNWSLLNYAREQVFYAETAAQLARARLKARAARERLARSMGLWGDDLAFQLPDRLPVLPGEPAPRGAIEAEAIAGRLDIRMAKAEVDGLARSLGLTRATRFVNVLEVSYLRNRESGEEPPRQTGYEIDIEIPIFDWGDARVAKAENTYLQAVDRLAEMAVNARSEVRESYAAYRTAYDLARHYQQEIVPVRRRISEEMVQQYSGMLVSVFELLADARDQIAAVSESIDAQREFWIADTDLRFATLAALPDR